MKLYKRIETKELTEKEKIGYKKAIEDILLNLYHLRQDFYNGEQIADILQEKLENFVKEKTK